MFVNVVPNNHANNQIIANNHANNQIIKICLPGPLCNVVSLSLNNAVSQRGAVSFVLILDDLHAITDL